MLELYEKSGRVEAGCDEAGRGCLAGPVVAAAVILDPKRPIEALNDSKQLSEKRRNELRLLIEDRALAWKVVFMSPQKIDEINILNASLEGMHEAALGLKKQPEHLLIDGNRFVKNTAFSFSCMIKGDARFQSIAAASILAKTHRDEFMKKIDLEFPDYKWCKNKGYPTKAHRQAIAKNGPSEHHRMSFKLLPDQLSLF
ncbi:MAG: ribonuclease HII [Flavobacteriales bacterium]